MLSTPEANLPSPLPLLLSRVREELAADFSSDKPIRLSRAPGQLDVMGGIADFTGSMVCRQTIDRAAVVASQAREDRNVQIFSFNLFDEHRPFTFRIPLEALAENSLETLRQGFREPGRIWASHLAGCLAILHHREWLDLKDPSLRGINLAIYSNVPPASSLGNSAAIDVAAMMNLIDHYKIRENPRNEYSAIDPRTMAKMCQSVANEMAGLSPPPSQSLASSAGAVGALLKITPQPDELYFSLPLPPGIRIVAINSHYRHPGVEGRLARSKIAAEIAHAMILASIRQMGVASGLTLTEDPMSGYLANLDPEDYKRFFRPQLPRQITGKEFLARYGSELPTLNAGLDPAGIYPVQQEADHHVLEARRVKNFAAFLESAATATDPRQRGLLLDKAGHLMYASHLSYSNDAMLGSEETDLLVDAVRKHERAGLYGARVTGKGSGGTVAILADQSDRATQAIEQIMSEYDFKTKRKPEAYWESSPGTWEFGTVIV
jgi:L-arabinokinase